jgi:hypothetical protein
MADLRAALDWRLGHCQVRPALMRGEGGSHDPPGTRVARAAIHGYSREPSADAESTACRARAGLAIPRATWTANGRRAIPAAGRLRSPGSCLPIGNLKLNRLKVHRAVEIQADGKVGGIVRTRALAGAPAVEGHDNRVGLRRQRQTRPILARSANPSDVDRRISVRHWSHVVHDGLGEGDPGHICRHDLGIAYAVRSVVDRQG